MASTSDGLPPLRSLIMRDIGATSTSKSSRLNLYSSRSMVDALAEERRRYSLIWHAADAVQN